MKFKHLIVLSATILFFAACSKDEIKPTPSPTIEQNFTPTNTVVPQKKTTKRCNIATFYSSELKAKFSVAFRAYFNESSPNGYVIIDSFQIGEKEYRVNTYNIGDDARYVECIHGKDFMIDGSPMLGNKQLTEDFRTAEALAATWYAMDLVDGVTIDESAVAKTGREMLGRKWGLPATVRLRQ
jgi:hypothetical protein